MSPTRDTDVHMYYPIVALCWAWGLLLNMIVIVMEQLYGEYPTKNVTLFTMAYGSYVLMPIVVVLRMIQSPLFGKSGVKAD